MEKSTASLTYKGSITDAIVESQRQKKLFVVYISGEDENSVKLEQSTWVDMSVADSVSRYCVFLHLIQGNRDALQFSAIYPQKAVPSITIIGYTGVLLWQHEGCIDPQSLVENIEKTWATLHLQETFLTAVLASKEPESRASSSSHNVDVVQKEKSATSDVPSTPAEKPTEVYDPTKSVEQSVCEMRDDVSSTPLHIQKDKSATTDVPSTSAEKPTEVSDPKKSLEQSVCEMRDEDKDIKRGKGKCAESDDDDNNLKRDSEEQSNPTTNTNKEVLYSIEPQETTERMTTCSPVSSQVTANQVEETSEPPKRDGLADSSNAMKSNDIHLNIRMLTGATLKASFTLTDTLSSVKNYIDANQTSGVSSYDLAVPYPRKVFNERDMNSPLSELGFAGRQALIVVPRQRATGPPSRPWPNETQYTPRGTDSTNNGGGYFGYLKWALSYMNPLSYLGRGNASSSSSEPSPSGSSWQYQPNSALQNQLSGSEASRRGQYPSTSQNPSGGDNVNNSRRTSRPFGSNIHTLRQNEDDEGPSGDRNTFWNGNSTQYGGNDK